MLTGRWREGHLEGRGPGRLDEIAFLKWALKASTLRESLSERARLESWTHEELLAAWESHSGGGRIRPARLPHVGSTQTVDDRELLETQAPPQRILSRSAGRAQSRLLPHARPSRQRSTAFPTVGAGPLPVSRGASVVASARGPRQAARVRRRAATRLTSDDVP